MVESEYGNVGFLDLIAQGRKPGNRKKTLGIREEPTTYSTHIWHWDGGEPGPHWWEASALIAGPFPLPNQHINPRLLGCTSMNLICLFTHASFRLRSAHKRNKPKQLSAFQTWMIYMQIINSSTPLESLEISLCRLQ